VFSSYVKIVLRYSSFRSCSFHYNYSPILFMIFLLVDLIISIRNNNINSLMIVLEGQNKFCALPATLITSSHSNLNSNIHALVCVHCLFSPGDLSNYFKKYKKNNCSWSILHVFWKRALTAVDTWYSISGSGIRALLPSSSVHLISLPSTPTISIAV